MEWQWGAPLTKGQHVRTAVQGLVQMGCLVLWIEEPHADLPSDGLHLQLDEDWLRSDEGS